MTDEETLISKYNLTEKSVQEVEAQSAPFFPASIRLSEFQEAVVHYVAGYAVKMVRREIKCIECCKVNIYSFTFLDTTEILIYV